MSAVLYQKYLRELYPQGHFPDNVSALLIHGLSLDSRKVEEGWLFIAVKGLLADGRAFIPQAIANGAACVFEEADFFGLRFAEGVPVVEIPQLSRKVSDIADVFYNKPSKKLKTLAITGTNGKSSCATLLSELLNAMGTKSAFIGTLGYGVCGQSLVETGLTTPDPIACQKILADFVEQGVEFVAMEASSHAIDQGRLNAIDFNGLIFTNLSRDHLDYHHSFDNYEKAKLQLFERANPDFIISNQDDDTGRKVLAIGLARAIVTRGYGLSNSADIVAVQKTVDAQGISAELNTPWGHTVIRSALLGEFNLYNLMAVVSAAASLGYDLAEIAQKISDLRPVRGRMQRLHQCDSQNINVVLDYAHTPDALEKSLKSLPVKDGELLWVVVGCGGDRDKGKRPLMGAAAAALAGKVILTSDNPRTEDPDQIIRDIFAGITTDKHEKVLCISDRKQAIDYAISSMAAQDTLLIAGKGHEDYQIIGKEKFHFDDAEIAMACLQKRFQYEAVSS